MTENEPLSIGRMSRLSGLTVKAVRYCDRVGLIRPAAVDQSTGFRYYTRDQVAPARWIWRLRSIDLAVDDYPPVPGTTPPAWRRS